MRTLKRKDRVMNRIKKICLCGICLLLMLSCSLGCASLGKPLMTLGESELTVHMVSLFLSRLKGTLTFSSGGEVLWDTIVDNEKGTTYNDFYTAQGIEAAKTYLAALHVFEQEDLELPEAEIQRVDAEMEQLIEEAGSKAALNEELAQYGANVNILREVYLIEAKMDAVIDHLYGEDGSLIAENVKDTYYRENYRRYKQIFLPLYEFVYETDETGESYRIRDDEGNYMIRELTEEELKERERTKNQILSLAKTGDETGFDALVKEYDQEPNESSKTYPGGIYLSDDDGTIAEVTEAVFDMEVGEIRTVIPEDGYGVYIIMRYELEEQGYALDANKAFFGTFLNDLKKDLIGEYLERYKAEIVVDAELAKTVDIKSVGANVYY